MTRCFGYALCTASQLAGAKTGNFLRRVDDSAQTRRDSEPVRGRPDNSSNGSQEESLSFLSTELSAAARDAQRTGAKWLPDSTIAQPEASTLITQNQSHECASCRIDTGSAVAR